MVYIISPNFHQVFGYKVVELEDKFKGSYILVNEICNTEEHPHLDW